MKVTLEAQDGGTRLLLEHTGFGTGAEWQRPIQESREGWTQGLENLASVMETGQDLRIIRRPMLGVMLSDFTPEIARQLGVPVSEGVRIDGTLEGMGARKAGLPTARCDRGDGRAPGDHLFEPGNGAPGEQGRRRGRGRVLPRA